MSGNGQPMLVLDDIHVYYGNIAAVKGLSVTVNQGEIVTLQDIFQFDFHAGVDERGFYRGQLQSTGLRPHFVERLKDRGIDVPPHLFGGGLR